MVVMTEDKLEGLQREASALGHLIDVNPETILDLMRAKVIAVFGADQIDVDSEKAALVLLKCAGVLIDSASRVRDVKHLVLAEGWLDRVQSSYKLEENLAAVSNLLYFLANARSTAADIEAADALRAESETDDDLDWRVARARARWSQRVRLRQTRTDLTWAARLSADVDGQAVGMRLCNLGNALDNSGRWIEAYDAYVGALAADPTNGNAAGNAAVLVEHAIGAGWDFEGHLCSLYDHYLSRAKANRATTVRVAGEAAAARFDNMELLGSHEPLSVEPAVGDTYQEWVAEHRLALIAGLEGVGSAAAKGRWDSISLRQVIQPIDENGAPPILSILNVLKADFLVARRLGFEAQSALADTDGWSQHHTDPGVYVETLDYAVVGEVGAKLVLAHRAALDVLDKTAVALNEHLGLGDPPDKVNFRKFWFEPTKTWENRFDALREDLLADPTIATGVMAMAELAYDMSDDGIYAEAQKVRNAGTHRFVLLHRGAKEVPSSLTMRSMTVWDMVATMLEALSVARAAYIYLVAMLSSHEAAKAESSGPLLTLPMLDTL